MRIFFHQNLFLENLLHRRLEEFCRRVEATVLMEQLSQRAVETLLAIPTLHPAVQTIEVVEDERREAIMLDPPMTKGWGTTINRLLLAIKNNKHQKVT